MDKKEIIEIFQSYLRVPPLTPKDYKVDQAMREVIRRLEGDDSYDRQSAPGI